MEGRRYRDRERNRDDREEKRKNYRKIKRGCKEERVR